MSPGLSWIPWGDQNPANMALANPARVMGAPPFDLGSSLAPLFINSLPGHCNRTKLVPHTINRLPLGSSLVPCPISMFPGGGCGRGNVPNMLPRFFSLSLPPTGRYHQSIGLRVLPWRPLPSIYPREEDMVVGNPPQYVTALCRLASVKVTAVMGEKDIVQVQSTCERD